MIACGKKHLHRNKRRHIKHDIYLVSALKRPDMERRGSGGTCARAKRSCIREMHTHTHYNPTASSSSRGRQEMLYAGTRIDVAIHGDRCVCRYVCRYILGYRVSTACSMHSKQLSCVHKCLSSRMRGCAHANQLSQKSVISDFRVMLL